ncbi:MAG: hypothetical protein RIM99_12685 [Cyclobacteriaceae bacterium]
MVWKIILSDCSDLLLIDVRNESVKQVTIFKFDLNTLDIRNLGVDILWWSNIEYYNDGLFISEYQDKHDPNQKKYFLVNEIGKEEVSRTELPVKKNQMSCPVIYEEGSESFKIVSEYLNLDLPCSVEYLELDDKIIISYYLRSGKEFDRYILVLKEGQEKVHVIQDSGMKGFAAGSFFVLNDKLFFIKERNEMCIYSF